MSKTDCTLGFLIGIGTGAAIGVLMAPQSGARTRRQIAAKAQDGADFVKDRAADIVDSASAMVDKGRAELDRQRQNVKDALDAGKRAFSSAAS